MRLSIRCSRLISFVRSFYFHFGCLSCMSFYRNLLFKSPSPPSSFHSTRMLAQIISFSSYIRWVWSVCYCNSSALFIRWYCRSYLFGCACMCMGLCWWLHCEKHRVLKTHFYHLIHCLFHYIEHIIRNKNNDGNGGSPLRQHTARKWKAKNIPDKQ